MCIRYLATAVATATASTAIILSSFALDSPTILSTFTVNEILVVATTAVDIVVIYYFHWAKKSKKKLMEIEANVIAHSTMYTLK